MNENYDYSNGYFYNGKFYKYTPKLTNFVNTIFKSNQNSKIDEDTIDDVEYTYKQLNNNGYTHIMPNKTSYKIVDNNVVLLYPDINYEFKTFQDKNLIELYKKRFEDLYCCCFNTPSLKVYKIDNINSNNYTSNDYYDKDLVISCKDITENECLFFKRFYCRALRDLVGPNNMSNLNSYCSCDTVDPKNRVLIKMGVPYNCIDKDCDNFHKSDKNIVKDYSMTSDNCNLNICENTISLSNILVENGINIDNINMNLYCQQSNNRSYV